MGAQKKKKLVVDTLAESRDSPTLGGFVVLPLATHDSASLQAVTGLQTRSEVAVGGEATYSVPSPLQVVMVAQTRSLLAVAATDTYSSAAHAGLRACTHETEGGQHHVHDHTACVSERARGQGRTY